MARLHEKEMRNYWGTWIVSYLGYEINGGGGR
jgi:hypothetical protein